MKYNSYLALSLLTCFLFACSDGGNKRTENTAINTTAPDEFVGLTGNFSSIGHGFVIDINYEEDTLALYDVTESSCVFNPEFDVALGLVVEVFDIGRTGGNNDEFTVTDKSNDRQTTFFERIDNVPATCANGGTPASTDPELNFQVFWENFNEHYAFFNERNIDWAALYEIYRPQVTPDTSQTELFQILSNLAGELEDAHVTIESSIGQFNAGLTPEFVAALALANRPEISTIIESYLDAGITDGPNGIFRYGSINGNIGYIQITRFGVPNDTLEDENNYLAVLDSIVEQFQDYAGIIFDVRNNGGGSDGFAIRIVNRFTDIRRPAYQEHTRNGNGFSPLVSFDLEPEGAIQFLKPVAVLAGPTSGSSAENFVLFLQELPQTTVIGEATNGTLSTRLSKLLPNGAEITLSNEIQMTPAGITFEVIGAQPDIEVPSYSEADINNGRDSALQTAIDLLSN